MPNDHNPPSPGHALSEEDRNNAEIARSEAEHFRRMLVKPSPDPLIAS